MATAVSDQANAFRDLNTYVDPAYVAPLRPHIAGGHAALFRHATASEKALISLGGYNSAADTAYNWPGLPAGSLVDLDYARLYLDDARLRYYQDNIGAGDTIAPVATYSNRIRAAATRFKTNTAAARSAALYDRDVTVGDAVTVSDGGVTLETTVAGLVAEVVAASVGSATADAANEATRGASSSISQTAGTVNDVTATRDVAAYSGLEDGPIDETYTITCTQAAGTPGDATTARLSVTSASGLDNQSSVTPSAYGKPTAIGTRGAYVTWSNTSADFVVGQTWTLVIAQAFTAITASSGGTFTTGPRNLSYIVTVTRGGVAGAANPLADPSVQATADPDGGGATLANPTVQATGVADGGGATGGLLAAGTYKVAYTFVHPNGETTVGTSASADIVVGATNIPRITLPSLPADATSIKLYVTDDGGVVGTLKLYASGITTTTYDMAIAAPAGAAPPAANTTTGALPAGTYYITYTFLSSEGETLIGTSRSAQLTVAAGEIPRVTLPSLPLGAVGINVYLTNTNGASGTERLYIRNVATTTTDLVVSTYDGGTYGNSVPAPSSSTAAVLNPQITAVDTLGLDSSGPTTVPGGLTAAVGSYGITLTFSGAKMRKGDVYYVAGTAATDGAIQTLVLSDNMNSTLLAASDLTLTLYIKKSSLLVPEQRLEAPPAVNWVAGAAQITVNGGMTAFDSTWTNGGTQEALPVASGGTLYAEYRAWLPTYSGKVTWIASRDDLAALLGTEHPDNPLCYGVGKALLNGNDQGLYFTALADPEDLDGWTEVLQILDRMEDIYGLVPLTRDPDVITLYKAHVTAQSTDELTHSRVVWTSLDAEASLVIVDATTTSDEETALATLADNPAASGTQYTLLNCTSTNAKFVTNGVTAGDVVRFLYALDGFGVSSWTEFTVASVVNEDQLLLLSGHSAAVAVAQRFEIWRNRSRSQLATALAADIVANKNKRWIPVWPDSVKDGDLTVDGWFLAAALAGLQGGVAPHQSLRNLTVSGFTDLGTAFNNGQLNTIELAGCFTVALDSSNTGSLYVRSAKTSDQTSLQTGTESYLRDLDAVRLLIAQAVRGLYGVTNVVQNVEDAGAAAVVRSKLSSLLLGIQSNSNVPNLDSMIRDGRVVSVRPSLALPNHLTVQITLSTPFELGSITLLVVAGDTAAAA